MVQSLSIVCAIVLICVIFVKGSTFPSNIKRCAPGDGECFVRVANFIVRNFKSGIKELNLQSIDPLEVEQIDLKEGSDTPMNINLKFNNVSLTGLSNLTFFKATGFGRNITSPKELKSRAPKIILNANYSVEGRLMFIPIVGSGKCYLEFTDWQTYWTIYGSSIKRDGREYLQIEDLVYDFDVSDLKLNFENLISTIKEISNTLNQVLNDSWRDILIELKPALVKSMAKIVSDVVSGPFLLYPYDDFFII